MATTGELRAIIEALELVDIGDAASYLGEEFTVAGELVVPNAEQATLIFADDMEEFAICDCTSCQVE
ncbi:MAG TPA: hypothetical protein VFU49_05960 [Ktedonobacteraceae bacterium]|nr:hypothetical protein [Ktedonobacteraceae bacterium]